MSTRNAKHSLDSAARASEQANADAVAPRFAEPDLDTITTVITGQHVWAARRTNAAAPSPAPGAKAPPLVPFEDLPAATADSARIAACTIRWQFTGRFNLNKEENLA